MLKLVERKQGIIMKIEKLWFENNRIYIINDKMRYQYDIEKLQKCFSERLFL